MNDEEERKYLSRIMIDSKHIIEIEPVSFTYTCYLCGREEKTSYFPPDWYKSFSVYFYYCTTCQKDGTLKKFITEPKPCPCCGNKSIRVYKDADGYYCWCVGCGLRTSSTKYSTHAVAQWNRRVRDDIQRPA